MTHFELMLRRHAPTILTVISIIGVGATIAVTIHDTPLALKRINDAEKEKGEELTKFEVIRVSAPAYIPTAITASATITCILGANILNQKSQAALVSAYGLLSDQFNRYRNAITDTYGEDADDKIKEYIAVSKEDTIENTYEDDGKMLFFDYNSCRYFRCEFDDLIEAENCINRKYRKGKMISINEFYAYVGLDPIEGGDDFFFNGCGEDEIEFRHQHFYDDNSGIECIIISIPELGGYQFM